MNWMRAVGIAITGLTLIGCATNNLEEVTMQNVTKINYIELPVSDMSATKAFYAAAFGWEYVDYGPSYSSFSNAGIDGGFDAETFAKPSRNGALVVMHAENIEDCLERVKKAGGEIVKPIFDFPGGRRFHFLDPNGNELAVWSERAE